MEVFGLLTLLSLLSHSLLFSFWAEIAVLYNLHQSTRPLSVLVVTKIDTCENWRTKSIAQFSLWNSIRFSRTFYCNLYRTFNSITVGKLETLEEECLEDTRALGYFCEHMMARPLSFRVVIHITRKQNETLRIVLNIFDHRSLRSSQKKYNFYKRIRNFCVEISISSLNNRKF